MKIVIIGLSITSSWGNGHATTYRSFIKELKKEGHDILFLEQDAPYYARHRDMATSPFCEIGLYENWKSLPLQYSPEVENADLVMVGSYVPSGTRVGQWVLDTAQGVTAFYDIDTPVTIEKLKKGDYEYLHPDLIPRYNMYLSFAGGKVLDLLENEFRSPAAKPFYCSVDEELYYPLPLPKKWKMGYLGTYSPDRQPKVNELLLEVANNSPEEKFILAGPQYPETINCPSNVEMVNHIPPHEHNHFYNSQQFTLNITRDDMVKMGFSPSVRLFEAAACGIPVISDKWEGIETIFKPEKEILLVDKAEDVRFYFQNISPQEAMQIGQNARNKVLKYHTSKIRARQLLNYVEASKTALFTQK